MVRLNRGANRTGRFAPRLAQTCLSTLRHAAITVVGLLYACSGPAPHRPETPAGPALKVMSFNINYGGPGADLALEAIRTEAADVVCLQETTPAWERFLRSTLRDLYPHMDFFDSGGAGGQALLSRFPFRRVDMVPSAVGWFPTGIYNVETPIGRVQVFNLHLHPAVSEEGGFTPSAYFSTAPHARVRELRDFLGYRDLALPTLMVGDFNEGDRGTVVRQLSERGLKDALPEFDTSSNTWRWPTSYGFTLTQRLDHLLYSDLLRCLDARVIRKGASDHYPVVAVFERR